MSIGLRSIVRFGALLLLAGLTMAQSCKVAPAMPHRASVDQDHYVAGEPGTTLFRNGSGPTAWLAGCSVFSFEQSVDGEWQDRGQPFVCVWEGFAQPVGKGSTVVTSFSAPASSGLWRLNYPVGEGCGEGFTQSSCDTIFSVTTNVFTVDREPCPPQTFECRFAPAAPNFLCSDGESVGGPSGTCSRDPATGVCGYEFLVCP